MRNAASALPLIIALLGGTVLPGVTAPRRGGTGGALPVASRFAVHFLDVGTGDAAIIDMGETEIVIDGGDSVRVLTDFVTDTGIIDGPIELLVVTHADSDHWKGLTRLLGFDGQNPDPPGVLEFWEPGYDRDCRPLESYTTFIENVRTLPGMRNFRRPLERTRIPAVQNGRVDTVRVPGVSNIEFKVLHTDSTPPASNGDCAYEINNASIVFSARIFGHQFLFTGDANGKERNEASPGTPGHIESLLIGLDDKVPGTLAADVLKVPHHGSETASTQTFIDRVNPRFVVISSSTKHELPRESVVNRYDDGERVILRTDVDRRLNNDHIVCFEDSAMEIDCSHLSTFLED
jgi:competence protein ComEC